MVATKMTRLKKLFYLLENEFENIEIDFSKSQKEEIEINARILKRYIDTNILPRKYVEKICENEVLYKILSHNDFNPLVINSTFAPRILS